MNELGEDPENLLQVFANDFRVSPGSKTEFIVSFRKKPVFSFVLFFSILLTNSYCSYKSAGVSTGELKILSW